MSSYPVHAFIRSRSSQEGVVLYIALIMLLLLSLIGVVGMQMAGIQERMSANYRNSTFAFQNADAAARAVECYVESVVNDAAAGSCTPAEIEELCEKGFDATLWAEERAMSDTAGRFSARAIGKCVTGNANIGMGLGPESETANPVFQITAYGTDFDANPTADAVIDTIFRP
ncbi:MAG: pilus assembly protein [Xanthomonadaceae bacterium]|jgi:type IV pilus assembly protein PilX|nr:pilus assembly protein [Xanthomonadaceae bacterium]